MTSSLPAAVLWDMDGTLVDTEVYWMSAETALVESFGGTWTHEQALTLVGQGLESSGAILQDAGVRMSVSEIVQHLTEQVMNQLAERGNPLRPGAAELLRDLRAAGVRTALVTMSLRSMAELVVSHPDPYLQACAALGVAPADTVAIEDSPTGVGAAVAAGIPTIGVPLMVSLIGTGATIWPTLEGRTPQDLTDFHAHATTHRDGGRS